MKNTVVIVTAENATLLREKIATALAGHKETHEVIGASTCANNGQSNFLACTMVLAPVQVPATKPAPKPKARTKPKAKAKLAAKRKKV